MTARDRLAAALVPLLTRTTARLAGRGPVLVPEYDLDPRARWGWDGRPPLRALSPLLDRWLAEEGDAAVDRLAAMEAWCTTVPRHAGTDGEPCWENDWWGTLDAVWQAGALRRRNPSRYVEVGSGWSTLFARRAVADHGLRTRITSIDPSPRREVDAACDEVVRRALADADLSCFADLAAGDVVLVDGSHVVGMSSDAVVFLLEVLPELPPGVLVGIDDVYLPWDYHPTWTGRGYGEQYLLAALLLGGGGGHRIDFPGWAAAKALGDDPRLASLWPVVENRFGRLAGSFWLETGGST